MASSHQEGPASSAEVATASNPSSTTRVVGGDDEHKDQLQNQDDSTSTMEHHAPQEESSDFVNQGLELWERARDNWLAHHQNRKKNHHKHSSDQTTDDEDEDDSSTIRTAIPLDVDGIIDVVFAPRWRGGAASNGVDQTTGLPERFSQNVPLPQMVDILQDLWEAEGLDV